MFSEAQMNDLLAFVLLHEEVSVKAVAGCVLIGAGTLVMVL